MLAVPVPPPAATTPDPDAGDSIAAAEAVAPLDDPNGAGWPDEAAESAFRAEARERGEAPVATPPAAENSDDTDAKGLPSLDELVQRIPADVRETLDELFRARFVTVKRVPKRALKA